MEMGGVQLHTAAATRLLDEHIKVWQKSPAAPKNRGSNFATLNQQMKDMFGSGTYVPPAFVIAPCPEEQRRGTVLFLGSRPTATDIQHGAWASIHEKRPAQMATLANEFAQWWDGMSRFHLCVAFALPVKPLPVWCEWFPQTETVDQFGRAVVPFQVLRFAVFYLRTLLQITRPRAVIVCGREARIALNIVIEKVYARSAETFLTVGMPEFQKMRLRDNFAFEEIEIEPLRFLAAMFPAPYTIEQDNLHEPFEAALERFVVLMTPQKIDVASALSAGLQEWKPKKRKGKGEEAAPSTAPALPKKMISIFDRFDNSSREKKKDDDAKPPPKKIRIFAHLSCAINKANHD